MIMSRKAVLAVLVSNTVFLLSVLLSLSLYWRVRRSAPEEPTYCHPDEDFSFQDNYPDLLRQLIVKNDKDTKRKQYCGKASDVFPTMIAKMAKERYNNNANPEYYTFNLTDFNCKTVVRKETKIHLKHARQHVNPQARQHVIPEVPGKPKKIYWKSTISSAGGLKHLKKEGSIYIHEPGVFYIFTQLTTRRENKTSPHNPDQTFTHRVYLVSGKGGRETILLENVSKGCDMTVEECEQTSNIGAVFELEENDRIYVATSHPYHVISGQGSDHFSIHKL